MNVRRRLLAACVLVVLAALAACGGGGGGGGGSIPGGGPTATPVPTAGFVPPAGAITLIASAAGVEGSALLPGSTDGVMLAQMATTPTSPPNGSSLTTFNVTVKENAGQTPDAAQRAALANRIREAHSIEAAGDRMRERIPDVGAQRRAFRELQIRRLDATSTGRRPRAAPGTVGTQRSFKILTSNIGNSGGCAGGTSEGQYECNTIITATLEAVGAHGNIWVDNASLATAGEFTNVPGEFQTLAAKFDQYYATETAAFGPAFFPGTPAVQFVFSNAKPYQCAPDGSQLPRSQWDSTNISGANGTSIDVVITDALKGTGSGGYYNPGDELPQKMWDCGTAPKFVSNNTSMFVFEGNNYSAAPPALLQFNESFWLNTDAPRSMAHELQHLLHGHVKLLQPEIAGTSNATFDDSFVEEGCSMLAEDLATDPAPGQHIDTPRATYQYMLEPSLYSLTSFTGYQPNPTSTAQNPPYGWYTNTIGSYGQAYLFMRYLYDRFGSAALTRIYANRAPSGSFGGGVQPVVDAAGGEPFPQLYREFAVALAAHDSPAATPPYTFSSAVVLRGTTTIPSRRATAPTRTLTFGGPQPPETFTNNLPTGFVILSPGVSASTFVVDGGTLFLPASNGSGGAAIQITGGPASVLFDGALVQGALPTPPPSSN